MDALKIQTKTLRGYVKKNYQTTEFRDMLDQIDRWFITGYERSDLLREVTVATIPLKMGNTTHYLSVKYTKPMYFSVKFNPGKFIRNIFRPSKAGQSWRIAHTLLEHKIPVPAPVAFLDQRRFRVVTRCYYIAEYLGDALNLEDYLMGRGEGERRRIIGETGRLIGSLHRNGFRHGDLGIGNMLISCNDTNNLCLYLVDIETITHHTHLPEREVAYDLACMYISVREILSGVELRRLIRAYFDANPSLKTHRKRLLREISRQVIPLLQRYEGKREKKMQHLKSLKTGKRVLFIDSVKEDGMMEIIETLKRGFPMSEFNLLVIREDGLFSQVGAIFPYLKEIKRGAYEIVIDWRGSLMTALLTYLSGAELRMGYRSRNFIKNRVFYNLLVRVHSWSMDRQIRLLAPLKALGLAVYNNNILINQR